MKKTWFLSVLFVFAVTGCAANSLSGSNTTSQPATTPQAQNNTSSPAPAPTPSPSPSPSPTSTSTSTSKTQMPATEPTQANTPSPAPSTSDSPSPSPSPTTPQPVVPNPPPAGAQQVIGNPPPSESVTADQVVNEFYYELAQKQYKSAWTWLLHEDQQSQSFEKFTGQSAMPKVTSVTQPTFLDSYTFHSFNKTLNHVAVVTVTFSDGSKKTVHSAKDEQGWKLAWNSDEGLE